MAASGTLELVQAVAQMKGLLIFCGATGSGKTSLAHAMLGCIAEHRSRIHVLHAPSDRPPVGVESRAFVDEADQETLVIEGMRLDPDILMCGDLRSSRVARVAAHAGLGSTCAWAVLRINAPMAVPERLTDMGVDQVVVRSALVAVVHLAWVAGTDVFSPKALVVDSSGRLRPV